MIVNYHVAIDDHEITCHVATEVSVVEVVERSDDKVSLVSYFKYS